MARIDGKLNLLQQSDFFGRCTRRELELILRTIDCVTVLPGELISSPDEHGGVFVVVLNGSLVAANGDQRRVIRRGDTWGAEALLARVRSDERLTAVEASQVAIAGPREFAALHLAAPGFAKAVSTQLARELVTSRSPRPRSVALRGLPALG